MDATSTATIQDVERILESEEFRNDPERVNDAEAILQQLPHTLSTLDPLSDRDLQSVVRIAMHDMYADIVSELESTR